MTTEEQPVTSVEVKVEPVTPEKVDVVPPTKAELVRSVIWSMIYAFGEFFVPIERLSNKGETDRRIIIESTNKRIDKNRDTIDLIQKTEALRHKEIEALETKIQAELRKVPRKDRDGAIAKKHKGIANGFARLKKLYEKDLAKIQSRLYIMVKNELVEKGTILDMEISEHNERFADNLEKSLKYVNLDQVEDTKEKMKENEDKAIELNKAVTEDNSGDLIDDQTIYDELDVILDEMDKAEEERIEKSTLKIKSLPKLSHETTVVERERVVDDEMEELRKEMTAQ